MSMYTVNSLNKPLGRKKVLRAMCMAVLLAELCVIGGNGQGSSVVGIHRLDCSVCSWVVGTSDHDMCHVLSARAFNPDTPKAHPTKDTLC